MLQLLNASFKSLEVSRYFLLNTAGYLLALIFLICSYEQMIVSFSGEFLNQEDNNLYDCLISRDVADF